MSTAPQRTNLAKGLAVALLGGVWARTDMVARCTQALGHRRPRRWVRDLVEQVLAVFPRPPRDSFGALAAHLQTLPAWTRALDANARVTVWTPLLSEMTRQPWPVTPLHTLADLARLLDVDAGQLAWFADTRRLERGVDGPLRHYRVTTRVKAGGAVRVLEIPKPRLREIQRRLLRHALNPIPVHPAARGCVPGESVRTAVQVHAGNGLVLRCDLRGFFPRIGAARCYGVLRSAGYPESVAHTITGLCTTSIAWASWRAIAAPADPSAATAHRELGRFLAQPHLPQGGPTSPALANLVAFHLDRRLAGLAHSFGASYTRYVDDLIFSAPGLPARIVRRAVDEICRDEGFPLADHKTAVLSRGARQQVLGAVINSKVSAPRVEIDRLRAILHNCAGHGWATQARGQDMEAFRAQLVGRVAWVNGLDARRGAKLRAQAALIDWTAAWPMARPDDQPPP